MAGHSKWANIQHRKNRQDEKRGRIFTRLIREVTVAARIGGTDPDNNPRLRNAIEEATANNVNKEKLKRAIQKVDGANNGTAFEEMLYEGYGPGGIAFYVLCRSDNRNRTAAEVRNAFTKYGGSLGSSGAVAYLFQRVGLIICGTNCDEDQLMDAAIDAGAKDMVVASLSEDDEHQIITVAEDLKSVESYLVKHGFLLRDSKIVLRPLNVKEVEDNKVASLEALCEALYAIDDVEAFYTDAVCLAKYSE